MKKSIIYLSIALSICLISCKPAGPVIIISTTMGDIELELYPEQAPITVANFIAYIDSGLFEGGSFYRTVTMDNQPDNDIKIEVIQGGRSGMLSRAGIEPIVHETTEVTGIKHLDGTISMARSDPGTASSEFFICINDQPSLDFGGMRNPDGQGFAAFGQIISGMDVVRAIQKTEVKGQFLANVVKINNIVRKNNK